MNITRGKIKSAQKVVIYGPEVSANQLLLRSFRILCLLTRRAVQKTLMLREWISRHRGPC